MAEVLVLVDHTDGEVKKVTFELLTAARELGSPSAVVVGAPGTASKISAQLGAYGAEKVYVAESDDAAGYLVTPHVDVLESLVKSASPAAVLVSASADGKEISGRLAFRIGGGLLYDVVGVDGDGSVTKSVFGGAFTVKSRSTKGVPVISVRPGAVEAAQAQGAATETPVDVPAVDAAKSARITGREPVTGGDRPEL